DIWPNQQEITEAIKRGITPEMFKNQYENIMEGDHTWQSLDSKPSVLYPWDPNSTYVRRPPYFKDFKPGRKSPQDFFDAKVLVLANEKVSTDHISPAGAIAPDSPAGQYLQNLGVTPIDFNTYGSRRGNHEVMMRGTFGNIRLRNQLVPEKEGWWTKNHLTGEIATIYDTAMEYMKQGNPSIVMGVESYGRGSSRDWAGKGPLLQGIKIVIAKEFERIHRSNLIGMGVLPMTFKPNEGWQELGLNGTETYDIIGLKDGLKPGMTANVIVHKPDGLKIEFEVDVRLDTPIEIEYFLYGGIMPYIVSKVLENK
ncbi:MAG: aconitate hydratase, partial [Candidatus Hodarchaeales archaeon]